jgi:acetylornithine deacetylase/succinyl-diaminopimelate desuccinylase-like protein
MEKYGMATRTDAFGNLYGTTDGGGGKAVMLGTHLDTVTQGGNFDGVVGFIVGVEAVRLAQSRGWLRRPVEVTVFRAEESTRFKKACLGSRAAFGLLASGDIQSLHYQSSQGQDKTLGDALEAHGLDPRELGRRLIDPGRYCAYFETHIEQARVLEGRDALGVVTSIRAPERRSFTVRSRANGRTVSRVAKATACMIAAVEWVGQLHDNFGADLVATVGRVEDYFHGAIAVNTIPGQVEFPLLGLNTEEAEKARFLAGTRRTEVTFHPTPDGVTAKVIGLSDHSGGTPMGRYHRRDALVSASEVLLSLHDESIPEVAQIRFYLDLRSRDMATRNRASRQIIATLEGIAGEFGVDFLAHDPTENGPPVETLDESLQVAIREAASSLGFRTIDLPSGAGHDAMIAAQAGIPTAMMFVPSREGLSHNPREFTENVFICRAIEVQAEVLRTLGQGR